MPALPQHIPAHDCLHYNQLSFGNAWLLQRDGVTERIAIQPRMLSNAAVTLRQ